MFAAGGATGGATATGGGPTQAPTDNGATKASIFRMPDLMGEAIAALNQSCKPG